MWTIARASRRRTRSRPAAWWSGSRAARAGRDRRRTWSSPRRRRTAPVRPRARPAPAPGTYAMPRALPPRARNAPDAPILAARRRAPQGASTHTGARKRAAPVPISCKLPAPGHTGSRCGRRIGPGRSAAVALGQRLEALQGRVGLPARQAADDRAARHRPERTERRAELVAVGEAGALAGGGQPVLGLGVRARRTAPVPLRVEWLVAAHELPLDLEVHPAQAQRLLHLVAGAHLPVGVVVEAPVDRYPVLQVLGVHRERPHLLRRGGDVDRRLDFA